MESVKRQFRPRNFGFGDTSPEDFYRFQWKWPGQPHSFIAYRIAIAVYQLVWNVLVIVYWNDTRFYRPVDTVAKWPIYISNWTFTMLTAYFVMAAVSTVVYHLQRRRDKVAYTRTKSTHLELVEAATPALEGAIDREATTDGPYSSSSSKPLPWYFKVTWCLQTIATSGTLFVAMGYWFFEYDPKYEKLQVFTIHVHAVGTLLALFDFAVSANACRILHFIYPMAYFTAYIIFSLIYYYCGGINPYGGREMYEGLIDWEDGMQVSVMFSAVLVFVPGPVLHAIYFGLYLLRRLVAGDTSCHCRRQTSYHIRSELRNEIIDSGGRKENNDNEEF